jgi:hypothetical protein
MSNHNDDPRSELHEQFAREAEGERTGLLAEFWDFLKHNKKWWLLPMLVVIALLAAFILLAGHPGTAPFIYPLF